MTLIIALTIADPVSIVFKRESPIVSDIICAPGAIPFNSLLSGKLPAAMEATCVPCEAFVFFFFNKPIIIILIFFLLVII